MSALERLQLADPVPANDRLLSAPDAMDAFVLSVMERSGLVDERYETQVEVEDRPPIEGKLGADGDRPSRRQSWLVAATAAAVTILVLGALAALIRSTSDPEPAAPAGLDEVGVVLSAYDALNGGDIDAWLDHFTDDASIIGAPREAVHGLYSVLAVANYRAEPVEPCRLLDPTQQGPQVECTITETNEFHGAGGISLTRSETFTIGDDGLINEMSASVISFTQPGQYVFNQTFYDWLREAHPDVHAEIRPELITHLPQNPDHLRIALEYMDEFIAQSDTYPVGG